MLSDNNAMDVALQNLKTHVCPFETTLGDYVVVTRIRGTPTQKPSNCIGPPHVVRILSVSTFEMEHLLTDNISVAHVSPIKPYVDALVANMVEMIDISDFSDHVCHSVDNMKDQQENPV